jgi:glycopeptide antibiotics resistance protein
MAYSFRGTLLLIYIIFCIVAIFAYVKYSKKENKILLTTICALFCVYLYFLIDMTQFPIYTSPGMKEHLGGLFWRSINLVPFKSSMNITSLLNIIATIPIGLFLPLMANKKIGGKQIFVFALLSGLILETLQLMQLILIGYTMRIIDINDIIFNGIGVLAGYLLYLGCMNLVLKISRRVGREDNFLAKYLI